MERNTEFVYLNRFVWDTDKNEKNKVKHGLAFELAVRIFADPLLYIECDINHSFEEDRNTYIGMINGRYVTTLVGTDREDKIRVISARKSTKKEVKIYEQNAKEI